MFFFGGSEKGGRWAGLGPAKRSARISVKIGILVSCPHFRQDRDTFKLECTAKLFKRLLLEALFTPKGIRNREESRMDFGIGKRTALGRPWAGHKDAEDCKGQPGWM